MLLDISIQKSERRGSAFKSCTKGDRENWKIVKQVLLHQMNYFTVLRNPFVLKYFLGVFIWFNKNPNRSYWNIALDDCHETFRSGREKK